MFALCCKCDFVSQSEVNWCDWVVMEASCLFLQALINRSQEADDVRSLLLDTFKHYSSRNQVGHADCSDQIKNAPCNVLIRINQMNVKEVCHVKKSLLLQSLLASPPPQWLLFSLQSFHSVVLEEPVYWLVALSARACLRNFLAGDRLFSELKPGTLLVSEVKAGSLYQEWSKESLKEVAWTHRYML